MIEWYEPDRKPYLRIVALVVAEVFLVTQVLSMPQLYAQVQYDDSLYKSEFLIQWEQIWGVEADQSAADEWVEQKEKLQHIIKTSKEYYRTIPLAFLKFSDSHVADTVGLPSTWVKLEKISFESLKTAFSNASELVSTEEPHVMKILDDLIKSPNSFGIPDVLIK
ncbi:MAG: hypothetical protein IIB76_01125 [Proteobacteria bacterium]|nr:hypothetical protein [Pseudomonadota bacterium]